MLGKRLFSSFNSYLSQLTTTITQCAGIHSWLYISICMVYILGITKFSFIPIIVILQSEAYAAEMLPSNYHITPNMLEFFLYFALLCMLLFVYCSLSNYCLFCGFS